MQAARSRLGWLRGLVRGLRGNAAIWYAPDQDKRSKCSEIRPFFGVPAITNTATSKIAEMTGCAVVPFFAKREADHSYTLTILPALENFPTKDAAYLDATFPASRGVRRVPGAKLFFPEEQPDLIADEARQLWG